MSERRTRWRLVLGEGAEDSLGDCLSPEQKRIDQAVAFLYDREEQKSRNVRGGSRSGSLDPSQLTVPDWINTVHELFPKSVVERLERDAVERYQIDEIVTNPEILERAQPSQALLKAVLRTRHLMNQNVLAMARQLVRRMVDDLRKKLSREVQQPFTGAINRRRHTLMRVAKNFDALTTIRSNLKHYDPVSRRLFVEKPSFFSRIRRRNDQWQIIILVDQSGSMVDSVIHSAVTASIFHGLQELRTHLVAFDTSIVDLTSECQDPVETLMQVQLGGGTDIGGALTYAAGLVEIPRRTIVVLITDFYEGGAADRLVAVAKALIEEGTTLLGLAALDDQAAPNYDRELAGRLVRVGAHVGAMTPGELAHWIAEKVR